MPEIRPPRLLDTFVVLTGYALGLGLLWYAMWAVVQGYPPLRIASVSLGAMGAIFMAAEVAVRRWVRAVEARARQPGMPEIEASPPPTTRDWLVSVLYGLLVWPLVEGAQSLAITQVPLAVVMVAAMAGAGWRLVLVRRRPGTTELLAAALSTAALVLVGFGPDAGSTELMIALVLLAPLVSALGKLGRRAAISSPRNQLVWMSMLVAAVVLQIAGLARGEVFGDAPRSATLALGAPLLLVPMHFVLWWIGRRGHPAVVRRSGAGMVPAVLLVGHAWCGQTIAMTTWLAAAMTMIAMLLHPPRIGDEDAR